jgi:DNA helicase-2/ATP-dependent DNA helicase PcrA
LKAEDLDAKQQGALQAVLEHDAKVLVLGGPGAGKTTTALWTARAFLKASDDEGRSPPARVLFLTFSRSAVSQLVNRQRGVLAGYERRVEIMTFHALAYRLLRSFGRYAGFGSTPPSIQSAARIKLLGVADGQFKYDDLVPAALEILKSSEAICSLVCSRWGLIICDEAQDTNDEQWQLLLRLARRKLLLLGDPNQMIFTYVSGVSAAQFERVRSAADIIVELDPRSHRDPSGAIPAVADAVRRRDFDNEAIGAAIANGRLTLHFDIEGQLLNERLPTEIRNALRGGSHDVGVFAHSNAAVAELAQLLNDNDINHILVGIPEAHAEALSAMAVQCAYAMGEASEEDLRLSLALFLTASVRGQNAPELALALIGREPLPGLIETNLTSLGQALNESAVGTLGELIEVATKSWPGLGIQAAYRPWVRAAQHFQRLTSGIRNLEATPASIARLQEMVQQSRLEALIDLDYSETGRVKLMNYHQTKGREADTVIHVFLPEDYFGRESEPFEDASKLLNVAVSRARKNVVVLLPSNPHALVEPFGRYRQ